ncbi:hypothetical protein BBK14_32015 [Parafrankia soli]|uniref:Uncharacterized protein n=1 Tax=Parafrankia soli TaxID=2599596 RepID=A0A1S1RB67_9ACTN|nr:hypothetical protein BBK14_32015 [Parafrankia soli]
MESRSIVGRWRTSSQRRWPVQRRLPGHLRGSHPDQQLSAGQPPLPLFDRTDPRIQRLHDTKPVDQLGDRYQPRHPGQRPVRRPDPYPRGPFPRRFRSA